MAEEKMSPEEFRRHYPEYTSKASTPQGMQYYGPIGQERESDGGLLRGIGKMANQTSPMPISDIDNWFTYHPPTPDQAKSYETIRLAAKHLAEVIYQHAPLGADRQAAIRKIREAVMTANAAIACGGW